MAMLPGIEEEAAEDEDIDWTVDNVLGHLVVETINATAVHTNGQKLKERRAHVTAFQEHAMTTAEEATYKVEAAKYAWNASTGRVQGGSGRTRSWRGA